MYNGREDHPPLRVKTWMPLTITLKDGTVCKVTDRQIQEVHEGEISYETDSMIFLVLSREKKRSTKAWEKIYALYPPSTDIVNRGFTDKLLRAAKSIR